MDASSTAKAKVLYLIGLSTGLFFMQQLWLLLGVAIFQLGVYAYSGLSIRNLWTSLSRLRLLAVVIVLSFLLIPSEPDRVATAVTTPWFSFNIYLQELSVAGVMLARIFTLMTTSIWVRDSEAPGEFIAALRWIFVPNLVAIAIDAGLQLSTGQSGGGGGGGGGGGRGRGRGRGGAREKTKITLRSIREGKMGFFDDLLRRSFKRANGFLADNYPDLSADRRHDTTIILSVVAAVMSLKLLQLLPGLPIAPGHKNLVIIPLLILAALTTKGRWGASSAGLAIGIVSFMMGYGKFGILEVAHFALPGLAADLLAPVFLAGNQRFILARFAVLGAIIGLTRFAANFLVLMLAGSPALAWVLFSPMLISQITFGALSAVVGVYVVDKIRHGDILQSALAAEEPVKTLEES